MRTNWVPWALSALLLASVLVGLVVERPPGTGADPAESDIAKTRTELPKFDCQDRTSAPYEISAEARDGHVAWLVNSLQLSDEQAQRMNAVFGNASITADDFWRQTRERYCDLREGFYADMRSVLTDKQLDVLEGLRREKRETLRREGREVGAQGKLGPSVTAEEVGKEL